MVSTGRGGTKRCEGDCGKCDRQRTGSVLSLDRLTEDGFDYADPSSVSSIVEDKLELELLAAALDKLAPEEKSLIRALFYDERTVRDCAAEIGISHQAVVKRKQKILEKLRGIDDVADEIYRLREEKQKLQLEAAGRDEQKKRIADMDEFLREQPIALTEYDEPLVRRLIEKVTVYEDKFTVEFKSGISININE